ncbi:hypothetical protein ABIE26_001601 [Pedobacter africanus]|uniref:Uncharacterized protein n=1 Tax=Pedobacter africanus TaxID=151894 RepID=A0ACC6KRU8_9SPHI|nr:hypothetical protein [Pedobacter africanus]
MKLKNIISNLTAATTVQKVVTPANYCKIMEYKVVPFTATLDQRKQSTAVVAEQLGRLIMHYSNEGWKYIRLESVSTYVQPDPGCFGVGGKPGYMASYQMVVFSKESDNESVVSTHD